ncbi:hypothetical protein [Sphaerothrix gracilis]|uniref:hypothetical protein n=1 Tax=Sphaerothrix gracilis TaxID=3151835 RepID=UPI0031FD06C5
MDRISVVDAFNQTLQAFKSEGITAKWLAQEGKIRENTISLFRNKQQEITTQTLHRLLSALPADAYLYFCSLLIEDELCGSDPARLRLLNKALLLAQLRAFIVQGSDDDLAELFLAIAAGYRDRSPSTDNSHHPLSASTGSTIPE